jgi:tetratricopeptide (TPR) repeat protein
MALSLKHKRMGNMTESDEPDFNAAGEPADPRKRSHLFADAGLQAYWKGDNEQALELLMKSLELKNNAIAHERLYIVLRYRYTGRYDEAFWHLEQSYMLQPQNPDAAIRYAEELVHQRKVQQAKPIVDEILKRYKTHGPALRLLNRIENPNEPDFSMEDDDDLMPPEEDDEDDPPDESYLLYHDGIMAYARRDFEKAYELLTQSLELKPHGSTHEWLYTVLCRMGKPEEAFSHIEQAARLSSNNNKILTMYAAALVKRGKMEQAKPVLEDVLRRSATYGPARRLLKEIETTNASGDIS